MTYHIQIITYPDRPAERERRIIQIDPQGCESTIPEDFENVDYQTYLAWVAENGEPAEVAPEWTTP